MTNLNKLREVVKGIQETKDRIREIINKDYCFETNKLNDELEVIIVELGVDQHTLNQIADGLDAVLYEKSIAVQIVKIPEKVQKVNDILIGNALHE